jgi:hypothetical protein
VGKAALEVSAPHILVVLQRSEEFIDGAEMATTEMRVCHRLDDFELLGWICS